MSKFKYTIPTPYGTETRTSARIYAAIVVHGEEQADYDYRLAPHNLAVSQRELAAAPGNEYWAKCVAEAKKILAGGRPARNTNQQPTRLGGYCGNLRLAEKLAASLRDRYEAVQIIEIKVGYVREIQPRARKEAV